MLHLLGTENATRRLLWSAQDSFFSLQRFFEVAESHVCMNVRSRSCERMLFQQFMSSVAPSRNLSVAYVFPHRMPQSLAAIRRPTPSGPSPTAETAETTRTDRVTCAQERVIERTQIRESWIIMDHQRTVSQSLALDVMFFLNCHSFSKGHDTMSYFWMFRWPTRGEDPPCFGATLAVCRR